MIKSKIKLLDQNGSSAIFGVGMLAVVVTTVLSMMHFAEVKTQQTIQTWSTNLETFYANEIAQVNGFARVNKGLDQSISPNAKGLYDSGGAVTYDSVLSILPAESYSPTSPPHTPYHLQTTTRFVTSTLLHQRGSGGMYYQVKDKP